MIFGYRVSLLLVVGVLGTAVPFGVLLGMLAGYFGGWVEIVIMRLTDIARHAAAGNGAGLSAVLSPNLVNSMLAVAVLWWTWHYRLVYRVAIAAEEFIEAARSRRQQAPHPVPRNPAQLRVGDRGQDSLDAGFVILVGASLSFLGLGIQPPTPDLGTMVSSGAQFLPEKWWESVLPGCAILFVALGFNLLGDGLRDILDVEDDGERCYRSAASTSISRPTAAQPRAARLASRSSSHVAPSSAKRAGKTVTMKTIMGILHQPPAHPGGSVRFDGQDLLPLGRRSANAPGHRHVDGLPGPDSSFNPVFTIADHMDESSNTPTAGSAGEPRRRKRERIAASCPGPLMPTPSACALLSDHALGRHAAARADRHGADRAAGC